MSDADLWAAWRLWMAVATLVILIAAGLLITIWITARKILRDSVRAWQAVEAIRVNTLPIWALQDTNRVAEHILETVQAIEHKGGQLAGALAAQETRR